MAALSYDFDIHWIFPDEVMSDPRIAKMMGDIGFNAKSRANYVALFRDRRTVDALRGADERVRKLFKTSGFGFNVYDSGAGPGRFPEKDEAARMDVIGRLSETMKGKELRGANLNGFDFGEFLKAVVEAKPVQARPETASVRPGDIDAAFANPKAGARIPEHDGKAPSLEEMMDEAKLRPGAGGADDLKLHSSLPAAPKSRGVPATPMIMIGAVMLFFMVFMMFGGGGAELVSR